ncbi:hypothetical protein [Roseomonas sp. BN140053]|uniref:hypothetical protein n=1 Tax=Roseomonas sp. BN140053 TaxID=3391898 RepID=UPI0039ED6D36
MIRWGLPFGIAALITAGALAQGDPGSRSAPAPAGPGASWFDPTQLPSFTGVVDRYLMDPTGRTERLVFREGPQVILPEQVAGEVEHAVEVGSSIVVWGIRARRAPVITMLAWAKDSDSPPSFVERPSWGVGEFRPGTSHLEVSGEVVAPLYTPQGEPMGAILQDGMVIRLPLAVAAAMGGRLNPGQKLAAAGQGSSGPHGRAVDAETIGESLSTLGPLPAPAGRRP